MSTNVNNNSNAAAAAVGPIANAAQAPPAAITINPDNLLGLSLGLFDAPPLPYGGVWDAAELDMPLEKLSCSRKRDLGPIQGWSQSTYVYTGPPPSPLPLPGGMAVAGPDGEYTFVPTPSTVKPHSGAHASTSGAGSV